MTDLNVRRCLHSLRQRWDMHTPSNPFCMAEEVVPGVTYGELCVTLVLSNRSRRLVKGKTSKSSVTPATPVETSTASVACDRTRRYLLRSGS